MKNTESIPVSKQPSKNISNDITNSSSNLDIFDKFHINYKIILEPIKDKDVPKTKYNKTLNKFIPYIQLKKLSLMEPEVYNYRKEIENLVLQNLTEIRRWYQ